MLVMAREPRPLLRYQVVLPFPPSVNAIWKWTGGERPRVIRDPAYQRWIDDGYGAVFEQCGVPGKRRPIEGPYRLTLRLDERRFGKIDQDNCLKAVSDLLQRTRLIDNDKNAWETRVLWADFDNPHDTTFICRAEIEEIRPIHMFDDTNN